MIVVSMAHVHFCGLLRYINEPGPRRGCMQYLNKAIICEFFTRNLAYKCDHLLAILGIKFCVTLRNGLLAFHSKKLQVRISHVRASY